MFRFQSFNFRITLFVCLIFISFDAFSQIEQSTNKRCRSQAEADSGGGFNACLILSNVASVSDFSFTTEVDLIGPYNYKTRWVSPSKVYTSTMNFEPDTYTYFARCPGRTFAFCHYPEGSAVLEEHWEFLVGTLGADDVGTWVYEELRDDVVFQTRTFEVKELTLTAVSGNNQMGIVDQDLPIPLSLQLKSFEGLGVADEIIGWSMIWPKNAKKTSVIGIGSGAGETDSNGMDAAFVHLGTKPGVYELTLNNRRMVTQPKFFFTAIDDINDTNPVIDHPGVEEGVGENNSNQCDTVGNPVSLSIGNKFQKEIDISRTGQSPIEFIRYHNSMGYVSGSFKNYWTHTYDRYIKIPANHQTEPIKVIRPDGKKINFTWDGVAYQAFAGVHSVLVETPIGWQFTTQNSTIENFDTDGRLLEIIEITGKAQTITYSRKGKLETVTSNIGTSLDFTYDSDDRLSSISTHDGRSWSYRYDILGRLQFVDNADRTVREYHYEDLRHAYALTGITNENQQRYSYYKYDDQGRAIASYHTSNGYNEINRVDIQYQANGDRVVLDPLGNTTIYQSRIENKRGILDGISGPICSQGCGLSDTQFTYDNDFNVISQTKYGVTTLYGNFDLKGQFGYKIEAAGTTEEKRTDYVYDPRFFNKIAQITEPSIYPGGFKITNRSYDANENLLSQSVAGFDPTGQAITRGFSNTYNGPFGQITSSDGPRVDVSDITNYEYYPNDSAQGANRAQLKAIVNPAGIRIRDNIQYSATGKILSESRPNNVTVNYEYFAGNDRIKSLTESGGIDFNRTQWEYYPSGEVSQTTIDDEKGLGSVNQVTQYLYDKARRLTTIRTRVSIDSTTTTVKHMVSYTYDAAGNQINETSWSDDTSQQINVEKLFDAYSRIDKLIQGGITEDFNYNPDGTLESKTDGNLNTTTFIYDALKRLTQTDEIGQIITKMTYNTHGNTASITDAENHATHYLYDDLGNLLELNSPDTGLTTYTYNESGQMLSQFDAGGKSSFFTYDVLGRMISTDRAGSDYDISYDYDTCQNGTGRLCSISTGWGHTIQYQRNELGDLTNVITNEGQMKYTYGPGGVVSSVEYPSGRSIKYFLDGGGLVMNVVLYINGVSQGRIIDSIQYSALNKPFSWTLPDPQQSTTITLDARHRTTSIDSPGVWNWQASQYDANDNLLNLATSNSTFTYAYDTQNRLVQANTAAVTTSYGYDKVGNRLSRTRNGVLETGSYASGSNQLTSFGNKQYSSDANGSISVVLDGQLPDQSYVYSDHNRLLEVIDDQNSVTAASYRYDGLGQRVQKITPSGVRKFIYGQNGELLVEMDGAGNILHEYVYLGGMPVIDLFEVPILPAPQADIIIDNDSAVVQGANWQSKSHVNAINGSYLQNRKHNGRSVKWFVDEVGFSAGDYEVFVKSFKSPDDGTQTTYQVKSGTNTTLVDIPHQGLIPGGWVSLGIHTFDARQNDQSSQWILLDGDANASGLLGTFLKADAVKLVAYVPPAPKDLKYIHNDHLGTPQVVTDDTGTIIWTASYAPFGGASVNEDVDGDGSDYELNIRFPGQYFDQESGLHYNYFRDYDPGTGRYIESDPIGLAGGVNTFSYVDENPLRYLDPLGLAKMCCRLLDNFIVGTVARQRHCYLVADDGTVYGLYPKSGKGIPRRNDPRDTGGVCKECTKKECADQDQCLRDKHNSYPIGNYSRLGPNSNTYAGALARGCCEGGVPSGLGNAPGSGDAPPTTNP